jgi:hypothetical protein
VLKTLRMHGRRYPVLHRTWGSLRWYSTSAGRKQLVQALEHAGWSVQCPFCGWKGSAFYPHPAPHFRPNAPCPRCGSKERHRALYCYLRDRTDLFHKPTRVLEVAPGAYSYRLFCRLPHVTHVGLDLVSPLARLRGDVTRLSFPDGIFDLVLCFHVLEHVPDDRQAIRELRRVLHEDGQLLVHVPIDREVTFENPDITDAAERSRLFGQADHVRAYGYDFSSRLEEAGLRVWEESLTASVTESEVDRYGLPWQDVVYACRAIR